MQTLPDNSVDMILCDLPYGTTSCKWDSIIPFETLWSQYLRLIKRNGAIVLFASQPFTTKLISSNMKMFKYCWYWEKSKGGNFALSGFQPLKVIEDIVVFSRGACTYTKTRNNIPYFPQKIKLEKSRKVDFSNNPTRYNSEAITFKSKKYEIKEFTHSCPRNLLYASTDVDGRQHPTQKPVALCEYLIRTYTNEDEIVLDNCMGSGTTGVACKISNRQFIGIEKDSNYYKIAQERILIENKNISFMEGIF